MIIYCSRKPFVTFIGSPDRCEKQLFMECPKAAYRIPHMLLPVFLRGNSMHQTESGNKIAAGCKGKKCADICA